MDRSTAMVELAMSLRQISDVLESSALDESKIGSAVEEGDSWIDDAHLYIDLAHSAPQELSMDLCVHDGRAFFRVVMEGLGVEAADVTA
jgi:hypothetical protein